MTGQGPQRGVLARHRNFRLYLFGQTVSLTGTSMQQVAVGWLALTLSNDAFVVGLVSAASTFPVLFLALPAGVLADRVEKLAVVWIAQALMLVCAATLWLFAWRGQLTIHWLLALSLLGGMLTALDTPARQALLVQFVDTGDLLEAFSLNSAGFNLARLVGPAFAAIVIRRWGVSLCFGANAISYVAVLWSLALIRVPARTTTEIALGATAVTAVREALRYVRHERGVRTLLGLVCGLSLLTAPVLTLLPVIARDTLQLDAGAYSALTVCFGVGALIGAAALTRVRRRVRSGTLLVLLSAGSAVAIACFAFSSSVVLSGVMLVAIGFAAICTNVVANSIFQGLIPPVLRGRATSIYVMVYLGSNAVGAAAFGWVARRAGASWALAAAAMLLLAVAGCAFRQRDGLRAA